MNYIFVSFVSHQKTHSRTWWYTFQAFNNYAFQRLPRGSSNVASFCYWGGGGGQAPQMYRQKKTNHVHVYLTYMRERVKRASASEIYVFSGLKIHLHTYNQCSGIWHYKWQYMTDKTLTLRKIYEYASELRKKFAFTKTAISFNILLVLQIFLSLKHIYFQVSNLHTYTINAVSFHYLWYGTII